MQTARIISGIWLGMIVGTTITSVGVVQPAATPDWTFPFAMAIFVGTIWLLGFTSAKN